MMGEKRLRRVINASVPRGRAASCECAKIWRAPTVPKMARTADGGTRLGFTPNPSVILLRRPVSTSARRSSSYLRVLQLVISISGFIYRHISPPTMNRNSSISLPFLSFPHYPAVVTRKSFF